MLMFVAVVHSFSLPSSIALYERPLFMHSDVDRHLWGFFQLFTIMNTLL